MGIIDVSLKKADTQKMAASLDKIMRIIVLGSSGSGKTTFARRLGGLLGREVIHLDLYYWQPGWTDTPLDEWRQIVTGLTLRERWVIDGFYMNAYDITFRAADAFVFLDQPRWVCMGRCVRRLILHPGTHRSELAAGCDEKIDREFLGWIWNWRRDVQPVIEKGLLKYPEKPLIWLQGSREAEGFLRQVKASRQISAASTLVL